MSDRLFGVVGSGTMGAGIAHAAAQAGFIVKTLDTDPALVKKAYDGIANRLNSRVERGKLPKHERDAILARLHIAEGYADFRRRRSRRRSRAGKDRPKEARFSPNWKRSLGERTLLASNTSSLSIEKLAEVSQAQRPVPRNALLQPGPDHAIGRTGARPGNQRSSRWSMVAPFVPSSRRSR